MRQILVIILLSFLLVSCVGTNSSSEFVNLRTKLAESLVKWKSFKNEHDATYEYVTSYSGNSPPNKTVITVEKDTIVKREHYQTINLQKLEDSQVWIEDSPETLGKNGTLKKVDDYYDECSAILDYAEANSSDSNIFASVSFDSNGLISNCGDGAVVYDDGSHTFQILKIAPIL